MVFIGISFTNEENASSSKFSTFMMDYDSSLSNIAFYSENNNEISSYKKDELDVVKSQILVNLTSYNSDFIENPLSIDNIEI